ncbi:hypothetical protein AB4072_07930 [Microvirga sp. 2MCAF38]|uniref:cadherin repeat domain-containing protein n=1 Tax=Microvirga sp. 2MCAF38 TaxID=3232989 RepID=UPI003F9C4351
MPRSTSDNHAPEITRLTFDYVNERTNIGTIVGAVGAFDIDGDALTYSLVDDAGGRFYMDNNQLRVLDNTRFSNEIEPVHRIIVRVTDANGASTDKDFVIRVLDDDGVPSDNHAPTDLILNGTVVQEGAVSGTPIGVLSGIDPDADENFTYEILDNAGNRFAIHGNMLVVADGSLVDYETAASHEVRIRVKDKMGHALIKNFTINVTDADENSPPAPGNHAPSDLWVAAQDIPENASAGSIVDTIYGTDPDGDALSYSLPVDYDGPFAIVGDKIVVRDDAVLTGGTVSMLAITVSDGRGGTLTRNFDLHITDVPGFPENPNPPSPPSDNHAPSDLFLWAEDVPETATGGSYVGKIFGFDPDSDALTYQIANSDSPFVVVGDRIFLREDAVLDYATHPSYLITVVASDGRGGILSRDFSINVKDMPDAPNPPSPPSDNHAPIIERLTFDWVAENSINGFIVGTVRARDVDGDTLTYELVDDADGRFVMDGDDLRVLDGSRFDDQIAPTHTVRVRVTDQHGLSSEKDFVIHVMDRDGNPTPPPPPPPVNNAPTIERLTFDWVAENSINGFIVGTVRAHDVDGDTLTYELVDDADGRFVMEGDDLRVLDGSRFDDQIAPTHTVRVRVTDQHNLSSEKDFVIHVMDRDGNPTPPPPPPPVNHAPAHLDLVDNSVPENAPNGALIGSLVAYDPDGDLLTYKLLDDAGGRFALHDNMIVVKDGTKLDFETAQTHNVTVRVLDTHGAYLDRTFTILIKDVTEGGPHEDPNEEDPNEDPTGVVIVGGNSHDRLNGGEGDDTILGMRGNDTIRGGNGDDIINGGLGKDVLAGGAGEDTFVFNAKLSSANVDRITDFSVAEDNFHLAKSIFKGIGSKGQLAKKAFWVGEKAHDANDRIIYDKTTGDLSFDADGTGAKAAVKIATLKSGLALSYEHFIVI